MPDISQEKSKWFGEFYERNYRLVYKICYMYMENRADAEDCTEDVFVKVLNGDFAFNDEIHEKKWLTVVAANLCKDRLKHWWKKQVTVTDEVPEVADESTSDGDDILPIVLKMPTKYKDVIYMYYYMGYKTETIAEILKKPPSTVRNHLKEARELLKKQIGEFEQ